MNKDFRKYILLNKDSLIDSGRIILGDYITDLQEEIKRLNNIINKLEEELEYRISYGEDEEGETWRLMTLEDKIILEKLQELKGDGSNGN